MCGEVEQSEQAKEKIQEDVNKLKQQIALRKRKTAEEQRSMCLFWILELRHSVSHFYPLTSLTSKQTHRFNSDALYSTQIHTWVQHLVTAWAWFISCYAAERLLKMPSEALKNFIMYSYTGVFSFRVGFGSLLLSLFHTHPSLPVLQTGRLLITVYSTYYAG